MRKIFYYAAIISLFLPFFGCATPMEYARGVLGISVHGLKNQKDGRYSFYCKMGYSECYGKVLALLGNMNAEIFSSNKKRYSIGASNFNSAFSRCLDTTQVGVFFESGGSEIKVEVVSKNYALAKFVCDGIISGINS